MHTFESFVSITDRLEPDPHQPNFSHAASVTYILSLLPHQARLALRLVSRAVKTCADTEPSPLRYLSISFPLSHYGLLDAIVFQRLSPQCWHLTVSLLPSSTALEESAFRKAKMPFALMSLTSLTHLHIAAPLVNEFYPLLAFRMALQAANVPNLSHMTISPLSLQGLMAMRWGPFSSFMETEWTGARVWRSLTGLEVGLVPWWRDKDIDTGDDIFGSERERQSARWEQWRTGVMVLHDWLASFAASQKIETLKLWWYEEEGLNPLLLDTLAQKKGHPIWHGTKSMKWKGLKYLWLGQCKVDQKDVDELRERCRSLEELWVEDEWLHNEVAGRATVVDGLNWTKVYLGFQQDVDVDISSDGVNNTDVEEVYAETVDFQDYEGDGGHLEELLEVPLGLET